MDRARSDLLLARSRPDGVHLADLCFHAQQAAEKAIKALLVERDVEFPYVHDLAALLALLSDVGGTAPPSVREAAALTPYATVMRYPGAGEIVSDAQYADALKTAEAVLRWAEGLL